MPLEFGLLQYYRVRTSNNFSHLVKVSQVSNFVPQLGHNLWIFLVFSLIPGSFALNDGIPYGQALKIIFVKTEDKIFFVSVQKVCFFYNSILNTFNEIWRMNRDKKGTLSLTFHCCRCHTWTWQWILLDFPIRIFSRQPFCCKKN